MGQGCSGSVKRGIYKKSGKEIAVKVLLYKFFIISLLILMKKQIEIS